MPRGFSANAPGLFHRMRSHFCVSGNVGDVASLAMWDGEWLNENLRQAQTNTGDREKGRRIDVDRVRSGGKDAVHVSLLRGLLGGATLNAEELGLNGGRNYSQA